MLIKQLSKTDLALARELFLLFQEIFEENGIALSNSYIAGLLEKPGFIAIAIIDEGSVIGGLSAYELPGYYSEQPEVLLYDIAVSREHQRKGIGTVLIEALRSYCKEHNCKDFFVTAHEEDGYALDFYRATGGIEDKTRHYTYTV